MTGPRATYRLQLNKDFTFADATALVPYLDKLGISHAYLSPILKARPGSTHGYDTVDHTRINPVLGTLDDFRALAKALHGRDMGIILDFVPNHMGVGGADNGLWLDVLKNGPDSPFADWFDIDWHPPWPMMSGKLLVPFLGSSYAESLVAGHVRLEADGDGFAVRAYDDHKLPIRPEDAAMLYRRYGSAEAAMVAHAGKNGEAGTWAALDSLIANQHWRLSHFAVTADEINYRRFFTNSDLAGIRIDRPDVFDHAHQLIFALIEEGLVDGLRIDHVDGLLDPKGYLVRLREKSPRPIYLVIEKILAPHEQLPADWPVDGTTGYETGALLTRLLVRREAEPALTELYEGFVGPVTEPEEEAYSCKLGIMDNELAAELAALSRRFAGIAWSVPATRDLSEPALRRALRDVIAHLAVYRTYADDRGNSPRDVREIGRAIARSRRRQVQIQPMIFDFVAAVLCGGAGHDYDPRAIAAAIGRFQQLSGPVMAKGLEDTALYRYNRLVALNEVGAHPDRFSISIAAFHDANRRRLQTHLACMIATSTHDTKRGEDIRAIIGSIADAPELWGSALEAWPAMFEGADRIHRNDLYLLFQLLLGGWPLYGEANALADRLTAAMVKSLREGRLRSDWGVNQSDYEGAVETVIHSALENREFLASFEPIRAEFATIGRRKAMVQVALKLTIPGVPDIYRGAEDWDQSYVDPDNRRPLDFASFARRLAAPTAGLDDKLLLTRDLLRLRRQLPEVFAYGSYEPLDCGRDTLGFRRRHGRNEIVVRADLSPRHEGGTGTLTEGLTTVVGSSQGPFLVEANI